jgi:phosphoglycerate-specific signal transduction histidine kinase
MKIEDEIHEVWAQIRQIRNDPAIPDPLKALALVRLFEVHNALDIECARQQEAYMQLFLTTLKLDELGARPTVEGLLKCHINQQVGRKIKPRSVSCGFRDAGIERPEKTGGSCGEMDARQESQLLRQRRLAIQSELRGLLKKKPLSQDDIARRQKLEEELRSLTEM